MTAITSFAQLEALKRTLASSSPRIAEQVARKAAPVLSEKAREDFDAQQSPYDRPWGTGVDGQAITLKQSGALRDKALEYKATGTKIRASVGSVPHARYQLKFGVLPRSGQLPTEWEAEVKKIADAEVAAAVNGSVAR